jgi:hypothetical protein
MVVEKVWGGGVGVWAISLAIGKMATPRTTARMSFRDVLILRSPF